MKQEEQDELENIIKAFQIDAIGLGAIAEAGGLLSNIPRFTSSKDSEKSRFKPLATRAMQRKISSGEGIFNAGDNDPAFRKILFSAHIAACCELFNGWTFPLRNINRQTLQHYVTSMVTQGYQSGRYTQDQLLEMIHRADAMRTMQILRELGFPHVSTQNTRQLSLACGPGTKDMETVHARPVIKHDKPKNGEETITFSTEPVPPRHVILVDNDPDLADWYKQLNSNQPGRILAMNTGFDEVIAEFPALQDLHGIDLCNFVLGLRIDHQMIPDIHDFFNKLSGVIDSSADLIVTIGSGFSLDEFKGRINVINGLFTWLRKKGMHPVRIRLYTGETVDEYRENPSFSISSLTTYDIIYCQLKRNCLP